MNDRRRRLDLIANRVAARAPRPGGDRSAIGRRVNPHMSALSPQQLAAWRHQCDHPDSTLNNLPLRLTVPGGLDTAKFFAAVAQLCARHEILRTTYDTIDGVPFCRVNDTLRPQCEIARPPTASGEFERAVEDGIRNRATRAFDLAVEAPLRVTVFEAAGHPAEVLLLFHHIVWDSGTFGVISEELDQLYADPAAIAPPPQLHYADFTAYLADDRHLQRDLAYWTARLTPPPRLPFRPLGSRQDLPLAGCRHDRSMTDRCRHELAVCAQRNATSRFVVFTAKVAEVLGRILDTRDVTVGVLTSRREHPATVHAIGDFSNLLTLRIDVSGELDRTVGQVDSEFRNALAHSRTHYETLAEHLPRLGNGSAPTAFDIIVVFIEGDLPGPSLGCSATTWERADNGGIQFPTVPLSIEVFLRKRDPQIQFTYSPSLVGPEVVSAIADALDTTAACGTGPDAEGREQ
ncbi:condensation domain-containing protein [Nocardia nova SH22a]|uniref:Condensation domain-containing protein n=1 Tax=Nocardia nova SH22a TaxID=1415166 RepID=W5TMC7_9NOCA|nr:condensation domain-containing protein [Nocardia nova]AHH18366.1 condensation domain-containing protein [Nocardia nova SH22a]